MFKNIAISAIAGAVPTTVCKLDDYMDLMDGEKFKYFTGVEQVRKTSKYQTASDLAFAAAENIINKKNLNRDELGALVFVAHSFDYWRPSTACVLHKRLKLKKECAAFDINLACSGFVYGLQVVCSMMTCSDIDKALILIGETTSKVAHSQDTFSMLLGDAGAAVLLEKKEVDQSIYDLVCTDGNRFKAIIAPAGGFRNPDATKELFMFPDGTKKTLYNSCMKGEDVFLFTISDVPKTIKNFLKLTSTTIDDYDCLAFHQANKFIHQQLAKKLKADLSKMPMCLDRYGNTSAPSLLLALCDKYGSNHSGQNLNVLMSAFGVGLSWGCASAIINTNDIFSIIETDEVFEEGIINSPEDLER